MFDRKQVQLKYLNKKQCDNFSGAAYIFSLLFIYVSKLIVKLNIIICDCIYCESYNSSNHWAIIHFTTILWGVVVFFLFRNNSILNNYEKEMDEEELDQVIINIIIILKLFSSLSWQTPLNYFSNFFLTPLNAQLMRLWWTTTIIISYSVYFHDMRSGKYRVYANFTSISRR